MTPKNLALLFAGLSFVAAQDYDYSTGAKGPSHWGELFSKCSLSAQSPIDIPSSDDFDEKTSSNIPSFFFSYDSDTTNSTFGTIDIINSGKDVDIEFSVEQAAQLKLLNAELLPFIVGRSTHAQDYAFQIKQIHFHWGSHDDTGSEHTIDGDHYALEMHIIHFNQGKYGDFATAFQNEDGILVVGVLFDVEDDSDTGLSASERALKVLEPIFTSPEFVVSAVNKSTAFKVSDVVSDLDTSKFYAYKGSLTNPTCDEVITWVVMKDILKVQESTIKAFRSILDKKGKNLVDNFRPTQPLNNRLVFDSEFNVFAAPNGSEESAPEKSLSSGLVAFLVIAGVAMFAALAAVFGAKKYHQSKGFAREEEERPAATDRHKIAVPHHTENPMSRPADL